MSDLFRRVGVIFAATLVGATTTLSAVAHAQGEPPARVGRLAFTQGTVSFHDSEQTGWTPAVVNTPLTSGDAIWTEPNARSEVSLAGTRIRMEPASQLDMLAIDDAQTRLQLDQGRVDVKAAAIDANHPYQLLTPRGTASLVQQGDYYIEAGSTQDATRLGVRAGAAQFQALNGQVVAVRPGEVVEVMGDADSPQIRTVSTAPPAPAAYWAARDRQVTYDQPPQYLTAGVTGYEDLNGYGSWTNDATYGQVWMPRAAPAGWAPYRTGRWVYRAPWGWTWVDEQPWGFAPYHYGRWANAGGRWAWVPPQREVQPVYAPALVAFVGGVELAAALSNRGAAPVGWFPLGPREVYVPPYRANQDYYLRLNRSAHVQDEIMRERWERAERPEAFAAGVRAGERHEALMNQRFATVVPATAFVRSEPVSRAVLRITPEKIAALHVAPVSAPLAPTASFAALKAAPANTATPATQDPKAAAATKAGETNLAVTKTAVAEMPTLGKPTATERPAAKPAPGPKIAAIEPKAATDDKAATNDKAKPALPPLAPRQGAAPPALKGAVTAVPAQGNKPGETATPQREAKPAEPPKAQSTTEPHAAPPLPTPQQQAKPVEPPKPEAAPAPHAGPTTATPQQQQQAKPVEPPKPQAAPAPHAAPQAAPAPQQAKPVEAPKPAEAPKPPQPQPQPRPAQTPEHQGNAAPPPAAAPAPPHVPQQAQTPAPQPQHAAPPPPAPHPAPQQTQAPAPPPQPHPAPQQAQTPAPQQQPHPAPQPQPQAQPQQQQQQQQPQKKSDEKK